MHSCEDIPLDWCSISFGLISNICSELHFKGPTYVFKIKSVLSWGCGLHCCKVVGSLTTRRSRFESLCGVILFSSCMCGSSPGPPASSCSKMFFLVDWLLQMDDPALDNTGMEDVWMGAWLEPFCPDNWEAGLSPWRDSWPRCWTELTNGSKWANFCLPWPLGLFIKV